MEDNMRKYLYILLFGQTILLPGEFSYAEDYSECKSRCAQDYTDCMNEPQASEPEVQSAKEATCSQKVQSCYSDCENLKPVNEDIAPESNPNVIRK
jgi:hypothetical protein